MFARLKDKSAVVQGHITIPLRSDFTPEDVPDSAKETASNWFYKVCPQSDYYLIMVTVI